MKKPLLFLLILICKHTLTQPLITLYNGVTINKGDTLYAGFSNYYDKYIGYRYSYIVESNVVSKYSNNTIEYLDCTDKLIAISYDKPEENLFCRSIKNGRKFYIDINKAIEKREIFTDYAKYGLNQNYFGVMKRHNVISQNPKYDPVHDKYPDPFYTNENFIYLWYLQSSLPEYAKLKKYAEIKYNNDCSNCTNETYNKYKEEVKATLASIDTNQIYSMSVNSFQFYIYDTVFFKLKISANEYTYSPFKEEFNDFFKIKCSNYPGNFYLKMNNSVYFSLSKMVNQNYINSIVNYKVVPKGNFDSDNDIRIKITSIDFYDEERTCSGNFLANYFGSVSFE